MMKCRYETVRENAHTDELGEYKTFGIRVLAEVASVSDVSPDRAVVDELCRSLNERGISPLELLDVIEKSI